MGLIKDAINSMWSTPEEKAQRLRVKLEQEAKNQRDKDEKNRLIDRVLGTPYKDSSQAKFERVNEEKKREKDEEMQQRIKAFDAVKKGEMRVDAQTRLERVKAEMRKPLKDRNMSLFEVGDKEE